MIRRMASLIVALGILMTQVPSAQAFELSAMGIMNLGNTAMSSLPSGLTAGNATGCGVGAFLAHELFPTVNGEVGLMYVGRGGTLTNASGNTSVSSYNYLMVPYFFRFEPVSLISVGAGPYFAYGIGNINVASNIPGLSSSNSSYDANQQGRTDLGLAASASLRLPIVPGFGIRGDVDYFYGLTNINQTSGTVSFRDLMFLLGITFGI